MLMLGAIVSSAALFGYGAHAAEEGIIKVPSAYSMPDTIARIKDDIVKKGIMFFNEIDQQKLAAAAGSRFALRRSSSSATRRSARSS